MLWRAVGRAYKNVITRVSPICNYSSHNHTFVGYLLVKSNNSIKAGMSIYGC